MDYTKNNPSLLLASLKKLIEESHLLKVINQVIDNVNLLKIYLDGT